MVDKIGIQETLASMKKGAEQGQPVDHDGLFFALATKAGNQRAMCFVLFDFVRQHIQAIKAPFEAEIIHSPKRTLEKGSGEVDDVAVLIGHVLSKVGILWRFKAISTNPNWTFHHVYVEALLPEGPLALDPMHAKELGDEPASICKVTVFQGK